MNKNTKIAITIIVAAAALAGAVRYLWSIRQTKEMDREISKNVRREFRNAPLDEAAARLEKLYTEKFFTVRFGKAFPYITMNKEPKVKYDFIGLLAEEAFIRLAGDVKSPKADTDRRLKALIDFSAKMIDGKRAYEYAREGEQVEMRKALINIFEIEILEFSMPLLRIRVRCSKGTYIRSLAIEIGEALESGAHLSALRRTRSGEYLVEDAWALEDIVGAMTRPAE